MSSIDTQAGDLVGEVFDSIVVPLRRELETTGGDWCPDTASAPRAAGGSWFTRAETMTRRDFEQPIGSSPDIGRLLLEQWCECPPLAPLARAIQALSATLEPAAATDDVALSPYLYVMF